MSVWGDKPIVPRAFALFERSVLALILYFWLVRLFRPSHAALAAITGMILSAGDFADPLASYNHDTILWTMVSGFLASFALDSRSSRALKIFPFFSGVAAGLSIASKQTIGAGSTVAIPIVCGLFLWHFAGFRRALRFIATFAVGWLLPALAILGWMAKSGLVGLFIHQAFVSGPAAKSLHGNSYLGRSVDVGMVLLPSVVLGCIGLLFLVAPFQRSGTLEHIRRDSKITLWRVLLLCGFTLLLGYFGARLNIAVLVWVVKSTIYLTLFGSLAAGIYCGYKLARSQATVRHAQYCLFAAVSFVVASMLSLSWPAFEAMVLPGLGFFIAIMLDGTSRRRQTILYITCAILIFSEISLKLNVPFGFADWHEPPVWEANSVSQLPEMAGFRLPADTVRLIDGTVRIIRANSTPEDTIFTYPEIGLFYGISHRKAPTFSGSHNIDVVNDAFASEEAETLLRKKPAVIIYYRQPEDYLRLEEKRWRGGNRSGQRDIIAAIESLIPEYRLAATFPSAARNRDLLVYVRR
jgi:hypothetical protein